MQVICTKHRKAGELTLPPANGSIGWPSWSNAGELSLVVWITKPTSSAATQTQIHDSESVKVGDSERASHVVAKLCDLHDKG